jgi:hypothetical protein
MIENIINKTQIQIEELQKRILFLETLNEKQLIQEQRFNLLYERIASIETENNELKLKLKKKFII